MNGVSDNKINQIIRCERMYKWDYFTRDKSVDFNWQDYYWNNVHGNMFPTKVYSYKTSSDRYMDRHFFQFQLVDDNLIDVCVLSYNNGKSLIFNIDGLDTPFDNRDDRYITSYEFESLLKDIYMQMIQKLDFKKIEDITIRERVTAVDRIFVIVTMAKKYENIFKNVEITEKDGDVKVKLSK